MEGGLDSCQGVDFKERGVNILGVYSSSAVAQLSAERMLDCAAPKFIWTITGYAGGESVWQMEMTLPSPEGTEDK